MVNAVRRHICGERVPHDVADKVHHGNPHHRAADVPERDVEFRLGSGSNGAINDDRVDDHQNLHGPVNVPGILRVFFPLRIPTHQRDGSNHDREVPENQQQVRRPVGAQRRFTETRNNKVPGSEKCRRQEPEKHHVDMRGPQAAENKLRDACEQVRRRQLIGHGQDHKWPQWRNQTAPLISPNKAAESGRSSRSQSEAGAATGGSGVSEREGSRDVMDMVDEAS